MCEPTDFSAYTDSYKHELNASQAGFQNDAMLGSLNSTFISRF